MMMMNVLLTVPMRSEVNYTFTGMKNMVLNGGLIFELVLTCVICYVPGVNDFFRTYPLKLRW
jgi:hypothetical protein